MREHFVLFSTTFVLTLLAIFILIPLAHKIGLVDKPHGRKQHVGAIPLIGGISIFSGVAITLLIFGLPQDTHWYYLLCGGSIVLLGVFDDFFDLSVKLRLCVQLMIGAVMVFGLKLYLSNLGDLVGLGNITLGYIGIPLTLIAVIAAINAFNMIDGIDGLAGMLSGVSFVSLTLMMGIGGQLEHAVLPMVLVFALIPYLLFNLDLIGKGKGKIFMGDAGSMLIGLSVIWLLIIGSQSSTASFRPVTALWIIAVPLMDMVAIMIRRVRKGQSPFMADREHLHHIFLRLGLTSRQALVLITSLASMLATIGIVGEYLMVPDLLMLLLFLLVFSLYSLSLQYIWRITRFIKRYKAKNRAKNHS
ncbi:MAG: UDP-N-acetylglucosamine--undecaprenyl-phosphate N-acetylglucosaminephosphotransferase [Gammaproteobacteria bacterium]|jgi:UDP-GlcNAc:undecaprenyl-phosphate/decaprenyl-phosphate GlcNAc-1-phosphate transferase|nr:UDP-N-acetylglucosamine--undecaprenyl-phosphate N-acetylglucosaminephosphotransferase [Gammaproteobacteria bacterium]MBU2278589.1 UDP-N-acetylglucosamine--undecaprenyl-phosphate N-acetylglucosaminephosphotransferase [Gammaproteobacteria bacterium]MBU2428938.1 UDP-N-acetylglucosamine--undecaprenyl-phosphate N-acetylglucosaminephosphotransferase [Gammaproteobacteria bacterium]